MLVFKRIYLGPEEWASILQEFPERTLYQSPEWLSFLEETQKGEIILAVLLDGHMVLGYFAGLMICKLKLRILGGPLPGWSTSYMGLVLKPEVPRGDAIEALKHFAFQDLGCIHLELMDRNLGKDFLRKKYRFRNYKGFEIDLSQPEDKIFNGMAPACRRCIRKAIRSGVTIQEANDIGFAVDYYRQLEDVFAKQSLIPTYTANRVAALIRHLLPTGNLLLLRAHDPEGCCIATGIFPAMHSRAYFWGAASWRTQQHLRPNELLLWHALQYWKNKSVHFLDMGGGGDYKRKYGGYEISVPWIRVSRFPLLPTLRAGAELVAKGRQKLYGSWLEF